MQQIHYVCDHCGHSADEHMFDISYIDHEGGVRAGDWQFCSWSCLRRYMREHGYTDDPHVPPA